MPSVTDLPIRQSTSPREPETPQFARLEMPSMWEWAKAGIGFTIGSGIAMLLAGIVYLFVGVPVLAILLRALAGSIMGVHR